MKINWKITGITFGIILLLGIIGFFGFVAWKNYELRAEKQRFEQEIKKKAIKEEKERVERAEIQKGINRNLLNSCLTNAEENYEKFWNSECEILGKNNDCFLPEYNADRVDKALEEDKAGCHRLHPIN